MTESKSFSKIRPAHRAARTFESDTMALQALRLIAAPNPKDDLNDEELSAHLQKNKFPAEMIQQIIDSVKSL